MLLTDRSNDMDWANFFEENKVRLVDSFSQLYDDITKEQDDEEEEKQDQDEAGNFFALKELMKLQYQMLTTNFRCF